MPNHAHCQLRSSVHLSGKGLVRDSAPLSCLKNPGLVQASRIHLSPSYKFDHTGWSQMWKNIHSILPSKPHPSKVCIVLGAIVSSLGPQETFSLDRNGQGLTIHNCRSPKHTTAPKFLICSFLRILNQITACKSLKTIFLLSLTCILDFRFIASLGKARVTESTTSLVADHGGIAKNKFFYRWTLPSKPWLHLNRQVLNHPHEKRLRLDAVYRLPY